MLIKDICSSITDGSHNPPQGITSSSYLMLSSKNVYDDEITLDEPRFLSKEDFEKENKRTNVKCGDVLLTIVGTVGRVAVVSKDLPSFTLQRSVAVLHPNENICNGRYLMYALRGKRSYIERHSKGIAQKGIYLKEVAGIDLIVPSKEIQEQIIEKLDKVNSIIKCRQLELKKMDELIKARFVEMFGDLANPKCIWDKCRLMDICVDKDDIKCGPFGTQLSKDEYVESGIAVWEIPQINTAFASKPTHFLTQEKAAQLKAYTIVPGDIAMSRKGNVGKCALFPENYQEGIIHSDVLRIRVDRKRVNPVFMMYQLHFSGAVIRQIELVSSRAIMAGVNVTKLKQIYVHIPPMRSQESFAAFVKQVDKSKASIKKSLNQTRLLFDSLMQKYFLK